MIRPTPTLPAVLALLASAVAAAGTGASVAARPKLAVAPFASASPGVPARAGLKAQAMLLDELGRAAGFVPVAVEPVAASPGATALEDARRAVAEAREFWTKKKVGRARESLARALEAYAAGAAALPSVDELADGHALAAAVAFAAGRDEDGRALLTRALALAPERDPPLAKTSASFTEEVAATRAALLAMPRGTLLITSTPANAPVTLDGRVLGATPLTVKDVPPGAHLWTAALSTGETVGGLAALAPAQTLRLDGRSPRAGELDRLLGALAGGRLDAAAVRDAQTLGRARGAQVVLVGALGASGAGLELHTFLVPVDAESASTGAPPRRLPRRSFDAELLSAGVELFSLAGDLAREGLQLGQPTSLPFALSTSGTGATSRAGTEVRYTLPATGAATIPVGELPSEPAPPPSEPRRRVPLKVQ